MPVPGLFTPFAFFILYDLFAVCTSSTPSESSMAHSVYVLYDSFYLFIDCKSQSKVLTLSKELINLALYQPRIILSHHPLYSPFLDRLS